MIDTFEEIGNKANIVRNIELKAVLKRTGCIKDKLDKAKWHTTEGVISVTCQKFMNWTKGTGGGGAIDLAMHVTRCDFKTAVFWLSDNFPDYCLQTAQGSTFVSNQTFSLPKRNDSRLQQIIKYLRDDRCIPTRLIDFLVRSGKLYADNRANAVFLLLGKEKKVVGAEIRGTTHSKWHGMAPGSRKDLGCFFMKRSHTKKAVLCESAIDAISYFALNPNCLALSTSGVNLNPAWLPLLNEKGFDIYCGFDSDDTGDLFSNRMIYLYPTVKRLRPGKHDWNEDLRLKSALR
ncbi:hypothetical protein ES703_70866 [subsurface metagenome]